MIPIHRYWTGPTAAPSWAARTAATAVSVVKAGRLFDWTDESLPGAIRSQVDALEDLVPEEYRPKHRANLVRLLMLKDMGGLWLDHDVVLLSMPLLEAPWSAASGARRNTSVMRFEAQDALLDTALEAVAAADTSMDASGELMLERVWTSAQVPLVRLPMTYEGERDQAAAPWAVHLWGTG